VWDRNLLIQAATVNKPRNVCEFREGVGGSDEKVKWSPPKYIGSTITETGFLFSPLLEAIVHKNGPTLSYSLLSTAVGLP
jgi:hypothetical protein